MDIGLTVTGFALIAAFTPAHSGQMLLRSALAISWIVTMLSVFGQATMPAVVMSMAALDIFIALVALLIVTNDNTRYDARVIGGLSMALMPAHWMVSVTGGAVDWTIYAVACNAVFSAQCLIAGGWFDWLGRSIGNFFDRLWPVSSVRDRA